MGKVVTVIAKFALISLLLTHPVFDVVVWSQNSSSYKTIGRIKFI